MASKLDHMSGVSVVAILCDHQLGPAEALALGRQASLARLLPEPLQDLVAPVDLVVRRVPALDGPAQLKVVGRRRLARGRPRVLNLAPAAAKVPAPPRAAHFGQLFKKVPAQQAQPVEQKARKEGAEYAGDDAVDDKARHDWGVVGTIRVGLGKEKGTAAAGKCVRGKDSFRVSAG